MIWGRFWGRFSGGFVVNEIEGSDTPRFDDQMFRHVLRIFKGLTRFGPTGIRGNLLSNQTKS